jgi:hypothetical protein
MFIISEPINGKGINLYLRFCQGFMDIVRENTGDPFTHTTIQFGAAFPFVEHKD